GEAADDEPGSKRDALETLRRRYAEGELSDEEFERKLENLLKTETLEDVRETLRERRGPEGDSRPDLEDRERE
ncbi:SHOCT domain-containing protein, partial [Halorussus sp. GCM10023401]